MSTMRKSTIFLFFTAACLVLFMGAMLHSAQARRQEAVESRQRATLVKELRLTDLCLFTEARYTRHTSMADLNSPFQDHPSALEHFPSGSFVSPPVALMRPHVQSR